MVRQHIPLHLGALMVLSAAAATAAQASETISATDGHFHIPFASSSGANLQPDAIDSLAREVGSPGFLQLKAEDSTNPLAPCALLSAVITGAQVIGGVMVILGMALGLTNYLVDAGIPDAAVEWAQAALPSKFAFLLALNLFLFAAGALMEIYAAIVVLVPLLLPVAVSYGIDPVHFGVIFLAVMEMGFLCPPPA